MGRGSDYSGTHEHYLLVDEFHDYFLAIDENRSPIERSNEGAWDDIQASAIQAFNGWQCSEPAGKYFWYPRDVSIFGETDRLVIGFDYSGGLPALFAKAKTYQHTSGITKEYVIGKEVEKAFNRLFKAFPAGVFRISTGAWCSSLATRYAA